MTITIMYPKSINSKFTPSIKKYKKGSSAIAMSLEVRFKILPTEFLS